MEQLNFRPPSDHQFWLTNFFNCLQKKKKNGIFLNTCPPTPNFSSQNDANQTYFWLLPNTIKIYQPEMFHVNIGNTGKTYWLNH